MSWNGIQRNLLPSNSSIFPYFHSLQFEENGMESFIFYNYKLLIYPSCLICRCSWAELRDILTMSIFLSRSQCDGAQNSKKVDEISKTYHLVQKVAYKPSKPKEYMVIGILRSNKLLERISKMKVEKIITEYKGKTYFGNLSSTIEEWRFLLSCKILKDSNFSHNISMITIYL